MPSARFDFFKRRQNVGRFDLGYRQCANRGVDHGQQPLDLLHGRWCASFLPQFLHILFGHCFKSRRCRGLSNFLVSLHGSRVQPLGDLPFPPSSRRSAGSHQWKGPSVFPGTDRQSAIAVIRSAGPKAAILYHQKACGLLRREQLFYRLG